MWIAEQMGKSRLKADGTQVGTVTVGGSAPAVVVDGEHRSLQVAFPKGVWWRPDDAQDVVVAGDVILGCLTPCPVELASGEVYLAGDGCSVHLQQNGDIAVVGRLLVNGLEVKGADDGTDLA